MSERREATTGAGSGQHEPGARKEAAPPREKSEDSSGPTTTGGSRPEIRAGTPGRPLVLFHLVFWLIAGSVLFISGLTQMPFAAALVRNAFLTVAGFLTGFALLPLIEARRSRGLFGQRLVTYPAAYAVSLFCVVVINAITYTQHGRAFADMTFGQWFSGGMNLGLVYLFWSELTIQRLTPREPRSRLKMPAAGSTLVVLDGGVARPIPLESITHVTAAGDYVEIHVASRARPYVDRRTMKSLSEHLPDPLFLRVHRSVLVNTQRVESLEPLARGCYRIALHGTDQTVDSSRGYRQIVGSRFGFGAR